MKVVFLEVESKRKIYREYNGGYGTSFNAGRSFLGKALTFLRTSKEKFPYMPYAYGATIFKQAGHDVSIEINTIPKDADFVIMHCSMPNHSVEKDYIRKLKEQGIIVGVIGPFPSTKPELFNEADFIISGEPETIMMKISKEKKIPKGLVYSPPLEDLDSLPYPDWSLFPINEYSCHPIINKKPFTFVLSSRGCMYSCNYCPYISESNYGRKFRVRSVKNVIGELKYLKDRFNIKGILFRDPVFSLDKNRVKELCNAIIKENIDIEIGCETRLDRLDKDLIDIMYKAGFRAIEVGIESSSPEVLRKSKRYPIELKHQEDMIAHCDKLGIRVIGFYVIGLEYDTHETIQSTIEYAKKLNTDFANFTICTPIPGTEFYENIKSRIFTDNYDLYDNFNPTFHHYNLSSEDIIKYQEKAFISYYLRLRYIYKYIIKNFFV